jgi:hypothetical protein
MIRGRIWGIAKAAPVQSGQKPLTGDKWFAGYYAPDKMGQDVRGLKALDRGTKGKRAGAED